MKAIKVLVRVDCADCRGTGVQASYAISHTCDRCDGDGCYKAWVHLDNDALEAINAALLAPRNINLLEPGSTEGDA